MPVRYYLFFFFLHISVCLIAQSDKGLSRKSVSRPEKIWALEHPLVAKRSWKCTHQVWQLVDSVKKSGVIGVDLNGGDLDAFKHAAWMCFLTHEIGNRKARKLGDAHEKGNYLQFKKRQLEDTQLPDSLSSQMDLLNNAYGRSFYLQHSNYSSAQLVQGLIDAVRNAELHKLKKSTTGSFLDCDGKELQMSDYKGRWAIPKCLIPTGS